jgi:hypothetical protein
VVVVVVVVVVVALRGPTFISAYAPKGDNTQGTVEKM